MTAMQIPCNHMMNPSLPVIGTYCFPDNPFSASRWTTDIRPFFDEKGQLPADEEALMIERNFRVITAYDTQATNAQKLRYVKVSKVAKF